MYIRKVNYANISFPGRFFKKNLFLFTGETVSKAIRRLAGGDFGKQRQQKQRKLQQKLKKGQVRIFKINP